jgi:hypothetical protein
MSALTPIAPKIAPLVRMLGSPVDGEALAACRAIGRTLDTAGMDFHDLAEVVERAALPLVVDRPRQEASPAPELKPWQILAMNCIRLGTGGLKPAELDFLRGMVHWPGEPSEKQTRWLDAIASALGIELPA